MIPFILHPGTVYTDTDSISSKTPLPNNLIGNELGLMKDELNGLIIKEAIFLDVKKYGYWYFNKNNIKEEKSVIAGVPRDTVNFEEIKQIFKGEVIIKTIPTKFYKSFKNLNISIKSANVSIKKKKLILNH